MDTRSVVGVQKQKNGHSVLVCYEYESEKSEIDGLCACPLILEHHVRAFCIVKKSFDASRVASFYCFSCLTPAPQSKARGNKQPHTL